MSATTVSRCVGDIDLRGRVTAMISKEAWANPTFGDTGVGGNVKQYGPQAWINYFMWPISIDNEAAYEYAVNSANPAPGLDPGVISDSAIESGIQAHWPPDSYLSAIAPPIP